MNLLVALENGTHGEELLASVRVVSHVSGWPVRVVHVKASDDAPDLDLPARLRTNTDIHEAVGEPVEAILAAARDDDVLAFGLGGAGEEGVAATAEALLARAPQPAFVMRPDMTPVSSLRRILVPLEGSPSSSEAMRLTEDAFCGRGREIAVLHVGTADTPDEPGSLPAPRIVDQEQYEWSSWHEEFTMRFATCPEGGRHRTLVRVGDPAEMIVAEAVRLPADLIVLAWNGVFSEGRSLLVRSLLGDAPCPLLLVPAGH
jgi:nucleotide-binding universal stress UspA family protein